ncbi:MAG: hypothetical protein CM15mV18_1420 [uncultured marine virus]|nr:MAG: hypothetical protein CM15mV18_1420 [uncultured marine virus]
MATIIKKLNNPQGGPALSGLEQGKAFVYDTSRLIRRIWEKGLRFFIGTSSTSNSKKVGQYYQNYWVSTWYINPFYLKFFEIFKKKNRQLFLGNNVPQMVGQLKF